MNKMNLKRLNIGAYTLDEYARSEKHIKELSDAGIDYVIGNLYDDRKTLDLFEKYGIGAIVRDCVCGWWGGDGKRGAHEKSHPIEYVDRVSQSFKDHNAIWGITSVDEPSALDFIHLNRITKRTEELFKNQFVYLNLYPNYATVAENTEDEAKSQLGTESYVKYIDLYCKNFDLDYICYDFYVYAVNPAKYYENFYVVTEACRKHNKAMWIVLQVNSNKPEVWLSLNNLRYQSWTSMAFGAQNIIWACYTAGWWHNQVLDKSGNKTEQYDKLKKVNEEIRSIADEYIKYENVSTHFVGFRDNKRDLPSSITSVDALTVGSFKNVRTENQGALVAGYMKGRNGADGEALMVCAGDDYMDINPNNYNITFDVENNKRVELYSPSGKCTLKKLSDNSYSVNITSNDGVFITIK